MSEHEKKLYVESIAQVIRESIESTGLTTGCDLAANRIVDEWLLTTIARFIGKAHGL
jgi:hypothetical protein